MMVSSMGKLMVALVLTGVMMAPACSGQNMRDRFKQRMAERRAAGVIEIDRDFGADRRRKSIDRLQREAAREEHGDRQ